MGNVARKIIRAGRIAFEHGLIAGASGNLSVRAGKRIHITRSGSFLGFLAATDIISCPFTGTVPAGASMETGMHLNCYRASGESKAVFHSQPQHATIFTATGKKPSLNLIPETMYYIKSVGRVGYAHAGSEKLAALVGNAAARHDLIILGNHGLVATGKTIDDALLKTIAFEFLCRSVLTAAAAGMKLSYLSNTVRRDFAAYAQSLRNA